MAKIKQLLPSTMEMWNGLLKSLENWGPRVQPIHASQETTVASEVGAASPPSFHDTFTNRVFTLDFTPEEWADFAADSYSVSFDRGRLGEVVQYDPDDFVDDFDFVIREGLTAGLAFIGIEGNRLVCRRTPGGPARNPLNA